ncbi:MAG: restriction endonuclease [Endomicrobia bacterium]|nr:restriction endonuclease [Endomicrobiia bacterium]
MILDFPKIDLNNYKSNSQKIRILSEAWLLQNAYCPSCKIALQKFENNHELADFYCDKCKEEFELKSKKSSTANPKKIADGEYFTKIKRLKSDNNPNLFFLTYQDKKICNLIFVPKYYFTEHIIERRKQLALTARRAGWTGSNIILSQIPENGKIFIIKDSQKIVDSKIDKKIKSTSFLKTEKIKNRGWVLDILNCVNKIKKTAFDLKDMYKFENDLKKLHPDNNHIKDKIRQQLQLLRNKKLLQFLGNGKYRIIV